MNSLVTLRNIYKNFGSRPILKNVSLDLRAGETLAYLGPNGAGKTTTIRIMLNLLVPDRGRVEIMGRDVTHEFEQVKQHIGVVSADKSYLLRHLTFYSNLAMFGELYGLPAAKIEERIKEVVLYFDMQGKLGHLIPEMSTGERIKAGFCRALLHDPQILILDEPTASMDVPSARRVHKLIEWLVKDKQKAVFMATHNMAEAQSLADRIMLIQEGRIEVQGTAKEVLASLRRGAVQVRVACADPQAALRVLDNGLTADIVDGELLLTLRNGSLNEPLTKIAAVTEIYDVRSDQATLEDLFQDP